MKKLFWLLIASSVFVLSCREEPEPTTLKIFPQHHGAPIYGATAYIEFNTQSSAGALSNYDLVVHGDPAKDYIQVSPFNNGNYFVLCVGYDPSISDSVLGGIPFVVPAGHEGEFTIQVPVTE